MSENNRETLYLRHGRLHYFAREILKRLRLPGKDASRVGDVMVAADLAGVEGEGVRRLPLFASRISAGLVNPTPRIETVTQDGAIAIVDGDNGMGHVVAHASMELALSLAAQNGIAAVATRHSNDFGMAGYYARMGLEDHMIGIAISNAAPAMIPTYGIDPMLGANPLAIAIPNAEDEAPFVLDMTTTAISRTALVDALLRGEPIPEGVALDASGRPTTDPRQALEAMRLLPLGSRPETGSHKGYGLGLTLDVLSGVLSGGSFGRHLAGAEGGNPAVAGIGHFFIAIRLRTFSPWIKFRNRMKDMLRQLTTAKAEGAPRIYFPGESEHALEVERRANGIPVDPDTAAELEGWSRRLDVHDVWEHLVEARK